MWCCTCRPPCFNPRPPRKVGATALNALQAAEVRVSILAHLARWALPRTTPPSHAPGMFQSSPTSQGGRYTATPTISPWTPCFNPRPPRKVGATTDVAIHQHSWPVSILAHLARWALPVAGCVYILRTVVSILAHLARWALRCGHGDGISAEIVSILAHLARWALQYADGQFAVVWSGFNPRPPRKVGATRVDFEARLPDTVSILAHLARWALLPVAGRPALFALFQSSPTSQGGRYDDSAVLSRPLRVVSILAHLARWALHAVPPLPPPETLFQSSPTSQGGRYANPAVRFGQFECFNPRPPRKVGATGTVKVSRPSGCEFQSSPTSQGGRYIGAERLTFAELRFNPRPPRKVGATFGVMIVPPSVQCFNPRPPRKVGATVLQKSSAFSDS